MGDDFRQSGGDGKAVLGATGLLLAVRRGGRCGRKRDVEIAFDELKVGRDAAQEGVDGGRGQVAQAEDLADFARREKLLEL